LTNAAFFVPNLPPEPFPSKLTRCELLIWECKDKFGFRFVKKKDEKMQKSLKSK